ncbi:MAG TPA: lipopolysaccharide heptosyltransferase II [Candidatus Binatia bacterium]|nr:lipopolysaccharide heptosyltransferase II [Candidatus Binatia bacterium]
MSRPRRILLAQTSFLGDVVLTTALARAIARGLPDAEIWWLVRPDAVELVAPLAGPGRVLAFDKRGADRGVRGIVATARRLRALRLDAAIAVQRSLRTAAVLALARIPLRVGYRESLGSAVVHRRVPHAGAHSRDRLLALAAGLGIAVPSPPPDPELAVDAGAASRIAARLADAGIRPDARLLALAPGSAWATKRWPAARFADAARELVASDVDAVAIVGARSDRPLADEIGRTLRARAARGVPVVDLTGETSTGELVALIARASIVVANDSAPAHVAAALGRPVVALFGPTVPAQGFAPLGRAVRIVERDGLACRPCSRHGGDRCPIGTHECLAALGAEPVVAAARDLIRSGAAPAARAARGGAA